jgi:hypothetical protein
MAQFQTATGVRLSLRSIWSGYAVWPRLVRCVQDPFDFAQGRLFGNEAPQDDCVFTICFQIDSLPGLPNIKTSKLSPGAMPDVEYVDSPSHIDTENNAIKMWLLAVQEVPEPFVFRCDGTAIGPLRQAWNCLF